jgi:hypothetical protein
MYHAIGFIGSLLTALRKTKGKYRGERGNKTIPEISRCDGDVLRTPACTKHMV